jgi:hypothetical protein
VNSSFFFFFCFSRDKHTALSLWLAGWAYYYYIFPLSLPKNPKLFLVFSIVFVFLTLPS